MQFIYSLYQKHLEPFAMFPGSPPWTSADIPDQTGKICVVTGGNTGLGKETCIALAEKGAKVYVAARTEQRALDAIKEIKEKTGSKDVFWLKVDLADLASVKSATEEFKKKEKQLHILINNAGVMANPAVLTKDGYDIQWGSNVVGHYALTFGLLPVLRETAAKNPPGTVRVVNVSSAGHRFAPAPGINFDDPNLATSSPLARYGQSKLGNILLTKELARRFDKEGIYSIAVHPGNVQTELSRGLRSQGWFMDVFTRLTQPVIGTLFLLKPKEGAITQLYAATSPEIVEKHQNGKYFIPYCREYEPSSYATDPALAEQLWTRMEKDLKGKI